MSQEPLDLSGVTVLVTRPEENAGPLAARITKAGGEAVIAPMIAIKPVADLSSEPLDPAPDIIIYISRNAVSCGWELTGPVATNPDVTVFAVGLGTRAELTNRGVAEVIAPTLEFSSEGLLALPPLARDAVRGKRIVIVRGMGGRETLKEALSKRGASVAYLEVYRRGVPDTNLSAAVKGGLPDIAVISSGEGLTNLADAIEQQDLEELFDMVLVVPGGRIAEQVAALGFTQDPVVADNPSDAGFMAALGRWVDGDA